MEGDNDGVLARRVGRPEPDGGVIPLGALQWDVSAPASAVPADDEDRAVGQQRPVGKERARVGHAARRRPLRPRAVSGD